MTRLIRCMCELLTRERTLKLGCLLLALLLVGCGDKQTSLASVFPGVDAFPDWTPSGEVEVFGRENIYDLVNGQAESFFAYGFEQVAVRRYENVGGTMLDIEVWQLATPADAYGLFTTGIAGAPAIIGNANDGDTDPGRRLAFWQDRYYVQVRARQTLPDAEVRGFAEAVSAGLPSGGERPALVDRLPTEGLVERSALFFHEEISIQDEVWLGGENLLGLGHETDGVLARYDLGGGVARLLLVQYPDAEAALAGLTALEGGQADPEQSRRVSGLVAAHARDNLLGAVFGEIDETAASALLAVALYEVKCGRAGNPFYVDKR